MNISTIDWIIILAFFIITLAIGLYSSRQAGKSAKDFFLSGRDMTWWLLGVSMVATTFSADTPNLVTDIVRKNGVAGNWVWWAFLLTGMATVFIYSKLWRRSGITTDLEFYELRYSGKEASFLRGFRSIYLGVFFNVMIMATVLLAGIKIGGIMLGISPVQTVLIVSVVTVIYSSLGGLRGVILTDFFQFILSMIGMIAACIYIVNLPEVGGLSALIQDPLVSPKTSMFPDFSNPEIYVPLFFIPLVVQWWSAWYPGAEPGGGGYIAQRMLSAKNERDAMKATLFFNAAHYALRPWPWILIALASLVVFPELDDIKRSFPGIDNSILEDDLAFPAMLSLLPQGLLGIVIASLIAALMSTLSTHLNWGSSYIVHDFFARFINRETSEKQQVRIGRISTVVLMVLSAVVALFMTNAMQMFNILLQIGAGTGLLFLLRWFWWRINAYSEIAAMVISLVIAFYFEVLYAGDLLSWQRLVIGVILTTLTWMGVTLITRPTDKDHLQRFFTKIRPHRIGWKPIVKDLNLDLSIYRDDQSLGRELLLMFLGTIGIYSCLFFTGYLLYGQIVPAIISISLAIIALGLMIANWK